MALGNPKRGDIIVFKHDDSEKSMDLIKRVVGLPKDHIQYKNKMIYVNGEPMTQQFEAELGDWDERGSKHSVRLFTETLGNTKHAMFVQPSPMDLHYPYEDVVVPENAYFVMGDNRDNSKDSRMWGFVKDEDIQGRAFGIWMSFTPYTSEGSGWQLLHWMKGMTVEKLKHWIRWERLTLDLR